MIDCITITRFKTCDRALLFQFTATRFKLLLQSRNIYIQNYLNTQTKRASYTKELEVLQVLYSGSIEYEKTVKKKFFKMVVSFKLS